jgi:hypothetical protein
VLVLDAADLTLENILIEGSYSYTNTATTEKNLGLAAGRIITLKADNVTLKGNLTIAAYPAYHAGMLAGTIGLSGTSAVGLGNLSNIRVSGNITMSGTNTTLAYVGGIVGRAAHLNINRCAVEADNITIGAQNFYGGGIVGSLDQTNVIDRCYFAGTILTTGTGTTNRYVGGLVGFVNSTGSQIVRSYSAGSVLLRTTATAYSANAIAGGILGYSNFLVDITNNYSSANVESYGFAGGLVGNGGATAGAQPLLSNNAALGGSVRSLYAAGTSTRIGNNLHSYSRNTTPI